MKDEKTNVMRVLEQKKVPFTPHSYETKGNALSGVEAAKALNVNADRVYKTLVTVGKSGQHYVFVIPAAAELDLKKAAKAVSEKAIEMLPQKELLPLTGYIHGGCSPIGMKKAFPTVIQKDAEGLDTFYVSAGKVGYQVEIAPEDLLKVIRGAYGDVTV